MVKRSLLRKRFQAKEPPEREALCNGETQNCFRSRIGGLTLGELEALAGTRATWFLALTHPGIASQKALDLEGGAVLGVEFVESAGDGEAECASLTLKSTTCGLGLDVVALHGIDRLKRLQNGVLLGNGWKIIVEAASIHADLAGAGDDVDAGYCRFAATRCCG
jgi:hypothetical protein